MKLDPATVSVSNVDPDKSSKIGIGFTTPDARYHFWWIEGDNRIDRGIGQKGPTLYKNSVHPHGHPEHFKTRYLDATSKSNAAICQKAIELAQPLIVSARAELERQKQDEASEQAREAQRVKWLDEAIARLDNNDGGEIDFNDVMTVVEFAKRMRADHQT